MSFFYYLFLKSQTEKVSIVVVEIVLASMREWQE
jgi:hypothetical protein